jgi:hypothetical protein
MLIPIIFSTITGNGYKLACAAKKALGDKSVGPYNVRYVYNYEQIVNYSRFIDESDIVVLTYWCDLGSCDRDTIDILSKFSNKKVIILGTLGVPRDSKHADDVYNRVNAEVKKNNILLGHYLCRGSIDLARSNVKRNIPKGQKGHLTKEGYQRHLDSQGHPTAEELQGAQQFIMKCIEKL